MVSNRFGKCLTVLAYFEFDDFDVYALLRRNRYQNIVWENENEIFPQKLNSNSTLSEFKCYAGYEFSSVSGSIHIEGCFCFVFDAFNIQMAYSMFIWLIEIFETFSSSLHIMDCKQINLFKALHQSIELSLRIYTHIRHIADRRIETSKIQIHTPSSNIIRFLVGNINAAWMLNISFD